MLGQQALSSIANNEVSPLLRGTPYGTAMQGALDFRQPIMDAIMGVDDEKAIVDMLSMWLKARLERPVSRPRRQLPPMPRNSGTNVPTEVSRYQQLYQAL